jgi:hypothetical protein
MRTYCRVGTAFVGAALVAWGAARPRPDDTPTPPEVVAEGGGAPGWEAARVRNLRAVRARLEAKDRVVTALLAGEATLLEAAARFREWDAVEPQARPERHPEVYAGDTEAERYCRAVLFWADTATLDRTTGGESAEGLAAVRRLEEELEGHRLCGTLELPRPPRPPRPVAYPEAPADE